MARVDSLIKIDGVTAPSDMIKWTTEKTRMKISPMWAFGNRKSHLKTRPICQHVRCHGQKKLVKLRFVSFVGRPLRVLPFYLRDLTVELYYCGLAPQTKYWADASFSVVTQKHLQTTPVHVRLQASLENHVQALMSREKNMLQY